nr:aminoacyl-histidine dipeptidase [Asgard group archaeon]
KEWAKKNNVKVKEDKVGNILLFKEATKGYEKYPTIILQGHLDMVCQKEPNVKINFENDPIKAYVKDNIVTAEGTSLGADNGIGVSYALAAISSEELQHGPIEVLLTVDEETGLTGAFGLMPGFFSGKYLLNLDSEDLGTITISSAGGGGTDFYMPIKLEDKSDYRGLKLTITGLTGGHSGTDIDLPRLNAIKIGVDALLHVKEFILLRNLSGGSAHNAIPRDFECQFLMPNNELKTVLKKLDNWKKSTLKIAKLTEPKIKIEIAKDDNTKAFDSDKTKAIIDLLDEIHHGPHTYSKEIVGLVQTSSNLATINTTEKEVSVHVSTRSSVVEELEEVRKKLVTLGENHNIKAKLDEAYPGWKPNLDSKFLNLVKKSYEEILTKPVKLLAIHAGLECGLFKAIDPEIQMAALGPNIRNAHSPDEYVEIDSVKVIWDIVTKVIENMGSMK